jgi:BirA family biotin operon repressor/biotin-[acetyl-CoA-carboxylase] ligase
MENLDINKIENCLNTEFIGKNIVYFKEIDSTNDYACALLEEHKKRSKTVDVEKLNGTLIISEIQKKGRGRFNRQWTSPPGGMWFTIILISRMDLKDLQAVTLVSAFSAANVLNTDFGIDVKIKWPNDIYYRDKKLGGILVESDKIDDIVFLISGFGLNVNLGAEITFPDEIKAISLNKITGKDLDRESLLCKILEAFENNYMVYTAEKKFSKIFKKIEKYMIY